MKTYDRQQDPPSKGYTITDLGYMHQFYKCQMKSITKRVPTFRSARTSDNSFGNFTKMLDYKLNEFGKQLVKIDK